MDRYAGKPFLRFLECYVLSSIGQLEAGQKATLQLMEPKLAEVYGVQGTWFEIVANQMAFSDTLPEQIRQVWENHLAKAQANHLSIDPNEFAMAFIDQNFPGI